MNSPDSKSAIEKSGFNKHFPSLLFTEHAFGFPRMAPVVICHLNLLHAIATIGSYRALSVLINSVYERRINN